MMDDAIDRGMPFQLDNLWLSSTLAHTGQGSLFLPPDLELPALDIDQGTLHILDVAIPELIGTGGTQISELESIEDGISTPLLPSTATNNEQTDDHFDFWTLDVGRQIGGLLPFARTWESFERKVKPSAERTAYISEAGPAAFDAALATQEPGLRASVLPQSTTLRALCNLALGRPSVFFQWDEAKRTFSQTLPDVATAGLSLCCSQSFALEVIDYATAYRSLQMFAGSQDTTVDSCATVTALKRTTASVLETIEAQISLQIPSVRSLLQLQSVLQQPQQLLRIMMTLTKDVSNETQEVAVISILADRVHAISDAGGRFTGLLKTMLAAICKPWLDALAEDLGLASTELSTMRGSFGVTAVTSMGQVNALLTEPAIADDAHVTFLSTEDRNLIRDTKASLAILRQHLPDHDLRFSKVHLHGKDRALGLPGSIANSRIQTGNGGSEYTPTPLPSDTAQDAWTGGPDQADWLEAMDTRMSETPRTLALSSDSNVRSTTIAALLCHETGLPVIRSGFDEEPQFSPFHSLRPYVEAQLTRLDSTLLQHLFRTCQLRKHLDLQYEFHLFGSGNFVSRLSTALFSLETQSAERKRGNVPTAETMGLRLSNREEHTWPPASSELRLTLAGVLNEAYYNTSTYDSTMARKQLELPGGLSFAIRELPDEDIERVMDARSLYALDFLRLQYSPPAPLDAILTLGALDSYDNIFRFLLKLMRVSQATTRLRTAHVTKARSGRPRASRFVLEAHHFISSVTSYVLDVGISAPWRDLQRMLDNVERSSTGGSRGGREPDEGQIGIKGLHDLHSSCLDSIRTRLFLKRKQEMTRVSLEKVLVAILAVAASLQDGAEQGLVERRTADFREAAFALINGLQNMVDKLPRVGAVGDVDDAEGATAVLLLSKLNWNRFYDGQSG